MQDEIPRVLAVDADEGVLTLYRLGLKEKGFDVYTASDRALAIESVEEEIPDAIILDMWMPGGESISFLKWLRASDDTAEIPIVAVSPTGADDEILAEEDLDWDHFIQKPVDVDELADVLEELTDTAE